MTSSTALRASVIVACLSASALLIARDARAAAPAPTTIGSGLNQTRATIPVTIEGQRMSCVLDTGSSAILVSPSFAQAARLHGDAGTFEVAPDGRTYVDRQTHIANFAVAGHSLHNVPALISSNLTGNTALCGYDFFAHFPTLIDRQRRQVTLYPPAAKLARFHCLTVNLSPHVPLATVQVNGSWVSHIVLDSGMAGGGALWEGVRTQLRQPLVTNASYELRSAATRGGFTCGAAASIRYAPGAPQSSMPICTTTQHPDGYNGIIETNLSNVHAIAVDYPRRRICFDVGAPTQTAASPAMAPPSGRDAWTRFNYLRPPKTL